MKNILLAIAVLFPSVAMAQVRSAVISSEKVAEAMAEVQAAGAISVKVGTEGDRAQIRWTGGPATVSFDISAMKTELQGLVPKLLDGSATAAEVRRALGLFMKIRGF